jgi:hypothetical protein
MLDCDEMLDGLKLERDWYYLRYMCLLLMLNCETVSDKDSDAIYNKCEELWPKLSLDEQRKMYELNDRVNSKNAQFI